MNSKKCLVIIISVVVMSSISMFSEEKGKEVYEVELSSGVVENEEYEERVVVRGRWGVGAGEFGIAYAYVSRNENLIEPIKPLQDPVYPKSLAVDSRGNIYILDVVNNRIQKFSNDGRYILEIPVESFIGAKVIKKEYKEFDEYKVEGLVKTLGVNIVIDSQDNLYYYCVKQEYDKDKGIMVAKKGEVWMFKDDKLVKRWGVPYRAAFISIYMSGLKVDELDGSIWISDLIIDGKVDFDKHYNVKEQRIYTAKERKQREKKIESESQKIGIKPKITSKIVPRLEIKNGGIKVIRYEKKKK